MTSNSVHKVAFKTSCAHGLLMVCFFFLTTLVYVFFQTDSLSQAVGLFLVYLASVYVTVKFFLFKFLMQEGLVVGVENSEGFFLHTDSKAAIYWALLWRLITINIVYSFVFKGFGASGIKPNFPETLVLVVLSSFLGVVWLLRHTYGSLRIFHESQLTLITAQTTVAESYTEGGYSTMFNNLFGGILGAAFAGFMILFFLGEMYWLWMSFKIGSFWMFFLGFTPPTMLVASVVGAYGLIFGLPQWVFQLFG